MLHDTNTFLSPLQQALLDLENSKFEFNLTGSRFFGGASQDSDWDFIACYSQEIEDFLSGLGYKLNEAVQDYLDPMTTKVFSKHFCYCEEQARDYGHRHFEHHEDCQKIDIQLCHDHGTKIRVRDFLKESFSGHCLPGDKYQRSRLWSMVYKLATTS